MARCTEGIWPAGNPPIPESWREALIEWVLGEDPVLAWIDACVKVVPIVNGGRMENLSK